MPRWEEPVRRINETAYRHGKSIALRVFVRRGGVALVLFLAALSGAVRSEAANWFVRPNGATYGSGNGSSWTNAWSGFSSIAWGSVACGDTIWIAGGTYTQ